MGGDATNNPDLVKIAGKMRLRILLPQRSPAKGPSFGEAKAFLAAFAKKYGNPPAQFMQCLLETGSEFSPMPSTRPSPLTPQSSPIICTKM